ncbi:MAG: hypothetical protein II937_10010 [Bacteroidales bacterium]|nr:hypothetical protein [Bacteroidales bacterium]
MIVKNFNKGFAAAFDSVKHGEAKKVKEDLMKILDVTSYGAFYLYKVGKMIPTADKAQAIINYFENKGITNVYE